MRTPCPLAALILATALLSSCGGSGAKRSVDAETEALRFFDAEAPLVALVDTSAEAGISDPGIAALNGLPPWDSLWQQTLRLLDGGGTSPVRLDALIQDSEPLAGLAASQLAIDLSQPQASLAVLVTDAPGEMNKLVEGAAESGRLSAAGELDEARIYESRRGAFAVRDGVMLAAATTGRLRQAIMTRDGDRGEQLDDRAVQDLLDEVPRHAPLEVYANVAALAETDAAVSQLASPPTAWLRSVRDAVFAVRETPRGLLIDVFGRLDEDRPEAEDPPLGERPTRAVASLAGIAGGAARSSPLQELLAKAAPLQTTARVEGDELRATLRLSR